MRISGLKLSNYRLHRELSLEFGLGITVLEGANETGKSTLVEALHRALFLSSRSSGALLDEMRPQPGGGDPELTLRFEAEGINFTLHKRFAGSKGASSLMSSVGSSWQGDKAEERLAELVGAGPVPRARQGEQMKERWGHLWVWQGNAGLNPLDLGANALDQARLLEQLQMSGQLGVQSQVDRRVVELVQQRWSSSHTEKGRIGRAGSALAEAQQTEEIAKEQLQNLNKQLLEQKQAQSEQQIASSKLAELDRAIPLLKLLAPLQQQRKEIQKEINSLVETIQKLVKLAQNTTTLKNELEPEHALIETIKSKYLVLKQRRLYASEQLEIALKEAEQLQQAIKILSLQKRLKEQEIKTQKIFELDNYLQQMPQITVENIELLRSQQQQLQIMEITMKSFSTKLELLEADAEVLLNGEPLLAGSTYSLSVVSLLQTTNFKLRLEPGAGGRVEEAKTKGQELKQQINAELERLGVSDVEAAMHLERKRSELENERKRLIQENGNEDAQLIKFTLQQLPKCEINNASLEDLKHKLDLLLPVGRERRLEFNRLDQELSEIQTELDARSNGLNSKRQQLLLNETLLKDLILRHGDKKQLDEQLSATQKAEAELDSKQKSYEAQLQNFKLNYLLVTIESAQKQREELLQQLAALGVVLRNDGINDRFALLDQLEAALENSSAERIRLEKDALMLDLLRKLLQDEQTAMALQYTAPVMKRLDDYLNCCCKNATRSSIEYQSTKGFLNLKWQRGATGVAWPFSVLSGGSKELLAAALRLSMAEVLAGSYNGCLPLVFDDAFSNVDPSRWNGLSDLLCRAEEQGLQLLVFSCDPSFTASLVAKNRIKLTTQA